MSKFHKRPPRSKTVIHKPDRDKQDFEVWVTEARYIGEVTRLSTQRVKIPGTNIEYKNVHEAAKHVLAEAGYNALADTLPTVMKRVTRRLHGMELVELGVWVQFAKGRGMNHRDAALVALDYEIEPDEWDRLIGHE